MILLEKIATSLHHGLNARPDCLQAFATVALERLAITSVILAISEVAVL
jgi:hypothetical protein